MSIDVIAAARHRLEEISKEIQGLNDEAKDLTAFLQTARRIELQMAPRQAAPLTVDLPTAQARKATKADVVEAARAMIRARNGALVRTGEVAGVLLAGGFKFGGETSSPSSIVSADLSAAREIERSPDGNGWIESQAGKLL